MSRRISNPKLAELLKASHMALHDLAAIVGVHRRALLAYSRGRPLPILERKLARVLQVSIPDLRDLLGINHFKRRKTHAAIAAESELFDEACASLRAYNMYEPIWRWANGRGRWVNGGERFDNIPLVQRLVLDAQAHPRANIIRTRRGEFAVEPIRYMRRRRVHTC